MNILASVVPTQSAEGSVFVSQRLPANHQPGNVEINRSVYIKGRGSDGKSYGRTSIQRLMRVVSGTEKLTAQQEGILRTHAVVDCEVASINKRLAELAGPARDHAAAASMLEARAHIQAAVAIGANVAGALRSVLDSLEDGRLVLEDGGESRKRHADKAADAPAVVPLLRALQEFNVACGQVQTTFQRLPKDKDVPDEVVLELQKTWFLNKDMFSTLKIRKCFQRPRKWLQLREQVFSGLIYRRVK